MSRLRSLLVVGCFQLMLLSVKAYGYFGAHRLVGVRAVVAQATASRTRQLVSRRHARPLYMTAAAAASTAASFSSSAFSPYQSSSSTSSETAPTSAVPSISSSSALPNAPDALTEFLIGDIASSSELSDAVSKFVKKRPQTRLIATNSKISAEGVVWTAVRHQVVLDLTPLSLHYLGSKQLSSDDTANAWSLAVETRLQSLLLLGNPSVANSAAQVASKSFGDGGVYQKELDRGIIAVQRASFLCSHLQANISSSIKSKTDSSPVTVADLAAQALIIDTISSIFPEDRFIAEEDSHMVRNDPDLLESILDLVRIAGGSDWNVERVLVALDKGGADSTKKGRVWVLDPIDGTKGFIRQEHYCVALALLQDGIPVLSVLGCPNLSLKRVIERNDVEVIEPSDQIIDSTTQTTLRLPSVDSGTVYFAVTGHGAYVRSLSMPVGAAIEVQISQVSQAADASLAESAEASFGTREITTNVRQLLGIRKDFLRLDGQCKQSLVGAGAAECNLRLPPAGYVERIWDHAPGYHFIKEAGGKVTDLQGRDLDFSQGKYLSASVTGIVASNGLLHDVILNAVIQSQKSF